MQVPKIKYEDLNIDSFDTIIDVRSPSEFKEDHITHSINLPVLSDEERALVGKTYKLDSRFKARKIGASLIARNTAGHLSSTLFSKDREWKPLIYCWRGGQRSSSFATILAEIGWRPSIIQGGYKNYRMIVTRLLNQTKSDLDLILLSGYTGTGKTEILQLLRNAGLQTINLESLANHRGSVFGAIKKPQPRQKLFESYVYESLMSLDNSQPVFLEAESRKIGNLIVPSMLWAQMKLAKRIEVVAPLNERAVYLTKAYKDLTTDNEKLDRRLDYLISQQGHEKVKNWKILSKNKQFVELAAELMKNHYDSRYINSREKSNYELIGSIELNQITKTRLVNAAQKIKKIVKKHYSD